MTESFPLLTVENVKHWYCEVEPHWSGFDIAKAVGCCPSTVYRFMDSHGITVRSMSQANFVRFECPHKYQSFLKQRNSEDFKSRQSEIAKKIMRKPEVRKRFLKATRALNSNILSPQQKIILSLLITHKSLFLTDLACMMELDTKKVHRSLEGLFRRQLVFRVKDVNNASTNPRKPQFRYTITQKGVEIFTLADSKEPFDYKELVSQVKSGCKKKKSASSSFSDHIGKHQGRILEFLLEHGPSFLIDLTTLGLGKQTVDASLKRLCDRGFLNREREVNENYTLSPNHKRQFLYSLTDKGRIYIQDYESQKNSI